MATGNLRVIFGGGGGGDGVRLSGLQASRVFLTANNYASYGNTLSVTGLNLTGAMTACCDIMVPLGKKIRIIRASLGLGSATDLQLSYEIDNQFVLEMPLSAITNPSPIIIGNSESGTSTSAVTPSNVIRDLVALERIRIFAYSPTSGASSTFQITYTVEV